MIDSCGRGGGWLSLEHGRVSIGNPSASWADESSNIFRYRLHGNEGHVKRSSGSSDNAASIAASNAVFFGGNLVDCGLYVGSLRPIKANQTSSPRKIPHVNKTPWASAFQEHLVYVFMSLSYRSGCFVGGFSRCCS